MTTTGEMHIADFVSKPIISAEHRGQTLQRCEVDDQFTRRRCASSSVRKVALGAIVASHLYNEETRRLSVKDNDLPADSGHCTEQQTLYASEAYEMLWVTKSLIVVRLRVELSSFACVSLPDFELQLL